MTKILGQKFHSTLIKDDGNTVGYYCPLDDTCPACAEVSQASTVAFDEAIGVVEKKQKEKSSAFGEVAQSPRHRMANAGDAGAVEACRSITRRLQALKGKV